MNWLAARDIGKDQDSRDAQFLRQTIVPGNLVRILTACRRRMRSSASADSPDRES